MSPKEMMQLLHEIGSEYSERWSEIAGLGFNINITPCPSDNGLHFKIFVHEVKVGIAVSAQVFDEHVWTPPSPFDEQKLRGQLETFTSSLPSQRESLRNLLIGVALQTGYAYIQSGDPDSSPMVGSFSQN